MPTSIQHAVGVGDTAFILHAGKIRQVKVMRVRHESRLAHPRATAPTSEMVFHTLPIDGKDQHYELAVHHDAIFESRDALVASL